jgi:aquaporin related protein
MFLTAQLVFTIFMLATEKHEGTFIAPVGIGLSLFVAELMGVYYTSSIPTTGSTGSVPF